MKTFERLEDITNIEPTVVALGNFDGIHKGHQEIIGRSVKEAEAAGLKSAVFTFSNHTSSILKNVPQVKNILYPEEKMEILESMGVDYVFNIPFTEEILRMSPEAFIEECFRKLGPYIRSTHIKDTRMHPTNLTALLEECSPGEGTLRYGEILRILDRCLAPEAPVLLEHMQTEEEYRKAYDYVAGKAAETGIRI